MNIKVTNSSMDKISVCVGLWSDEGNGSYYDLKAGAVGDWHRPDDRGYLMIILRGAKAEYYFVRAHGEYEVRDDGVKNALELPIE